MELSMLMLDMDLTLNNSDVFLELHHTISDFILINLMCHMAFLSSPMELSMLTLDMLDKDLTLYNSDVFLQLRHSVSDFILINLMCHMTPLSNSMELHVHALLGHVGHGPCPELLQGSLGVLS
jgi:hypothetical protein